MSNDPAVSTITPVSSHGTAESTPPAVWLCVLCFIPVALLWSYRDAAFVSDDRWFATAPALGGANWLIAPWPHPFGPAHAYRPIVLLTYWLNQQLSSGAPFAFHVTNFLIHGINAALLTALLFRLSRSRLAAGLAGLLFAIHPMTHENVVWVSGRTYPLASSFGLALLLWTSTANDPTRSRWLQHGVGICLLLGALMSYEMAVTLPLMVAAVHFHVRKSITRRQSGASSVWMQTVRFTAPYLVLLAGYLLFRWVLISSFTGDSSVWRHGINPDPNMVNVRVRVLHNLGTLAQRLLNADDTLFGPLWSLRTSTTVASALLTGVALWGAVASREVRGLALGAVALAGLSFAPAVVGPGFNDRLTYLTVAGSVSAVALGVGAMPRRVRLAGQLAVALCTVAVIVNWGVRYRVLASEWQHAGAISESLLDQLVALEPTPAPHAELHFADVPVRFRDAYAYVTYFHYSVRHRYGREDLAIVTHGGDEVPALVARWVPSAEDGSVAPQVALFRWDAGAERLHLLWRQRSRLGD